jgi:hypothetical protein
MENKKKEKQEEDSKKKKKQEEEIDEELEQTFPASDPPSYSQPEKPKKDEE